MTHNIKFNNIYYPYYKIRIEDEGVADRIGINLSHLYDYIGAHKNMGGHNNRGNALRAIKRRANELTGSRRKIISKRQVSALVNFYPRCFQYNRNSTIKIPYLTAYIFEAIFTLAEEINNDYPMPAELSSFIGNCRREIFYREQCDLFHYQYNRFPENRTALTIALCDDLFSETSVLSFNFEV